MRCALRVPCRAPRPTEETKWSPAAGLANAMSVQRKARKTGAGSSMANLCKIYLIATCGADKIVHTDAVFKGCTIVVNAPIGPEDDRKKYETLLRASITRRGLSLLPVRPDAVELTYH